MPQKVLVMTPFQDRAIGSASSATTPVIDMRDYDRVESIFVRGQSSAGSVKYTLEWVGGITEDHFQEWADNDDLLTDETAETWKVIFPPSFRSPFVKFKLSTHADSNADGTFTLYIYLREDYA